MTPTLLAGAREHLWLIWPLGAVVLWMLAAYQSGRQVEPFRDWPFVCVIIIPMWPLMLALAVAMQPFFWLAALGEKHRPPSPENNHE